MSQAQGVAALKMLRKGRAMGCGGGEEVEAGLFSTPPDAVVVAPGVQVLSSHSGRVRFDVVLEGRGVKRDDMEAYGFSWDGNSYVRVQFGETGRIQDLWATGAVDASHDAATHMTYMTLRGARSKTTFLGDMERLCNTMGFVYDRGKSASNKRMTWSKTMGDVDWTSFQATFARHHRRQSAEDRHALLQQKLEEERARMREVTREKNRAKALQDELNDPTYRPRLEDYGKLIRWMSVTGNHYIAQDGGIDWPSPPVPMEKGIVSLKSAHLVPSNAPSFRSQSSGS
jgi:hypothetical protein